MVRGKKSRIDPSPRVLRTPSLYPPENLESGLSKHAAIMSGLSETQDRIKKVSILITVGAHHHYYILLLSRVLFVQSQLVNTGQFSLLIWRTADWY